MAAQRPTYQLVTTGSAAPGEELLAEVAARTGIPELAGRRDGWLRRLCGWLLSGTPR